MPEFQSPGGDSLYSDAPLGVQEVTEKVGFNPLAGIRCIQTGERQPGMGRATASFNPLAGIRCIQTLRHPDCWDRTLRVSIPWRGFVVFRRRASLCRRCNLLQGFNPLAGIRCIQTGVE